MRLFQKHCPGLYSRFSRTWATNMGTWEHGNMGFGIWKDAKIIINIM